MPTLTERGVRRMLLVALAVLVAYWSLWFGHRPWVASQTRPAYVEFEDAFLLAAAGAGLYLLGIDVLYDLEHGIYATGAGGAIEAAVNLLTLSFSVLALRWTWRERLRLLGVSDRE